MRKREWIVWLHNLNGWFISPNEQTASWGEARKFTLSGALEIVAMLNSDLKEREKPRASMISVITYT